MATLIAGKETIVTSETLTGPTFKGTQKFGNGGATTDSIGFWGATPATRPAGASQAAVTTITGGKTTTNVAAKLNLLIKYCMKNRTDMIALGLIKGAA